MDKELKQTAIQMARVSSIGIAMVIAIFGCFYLGRWLDRQLETEPYLTLLFLLIETCISSSRGTLRTINHHQVCKKWTS